MTRECVLMANAAIPRDQVHTLAEACGDAGDDFQSSAARLIKEQRRLSRFFEQNGGAMGPMSSQVSIYMLSVVLRIFEQCGGRMKKVNGQQIDTAIARIQECVGEQANHDGAFSDWAKSIAWRAQPHILDEVLWALYERENEDRKEGEVDLDQGQSKMVYIMLWTAVEALDANWTPAP